MTTTPVKQSAQTQTVFPQGYRVNSGRIILYMLLIFVALVWVAPFLWMLVTSIKPETEIFRYPVDWVPDKPITEYYTRLFDNFAMAKWFRNSLIVATMTTTLTLVVDVLAAYPLARIKFRGRRILMLMILSTFLLPGEILLVPLFLGLSDLKLLDSYFSLAVPPAANAFGVFLMTQFFLTIPLELEEAARLDGCGHFGIVWRIFIPLSKPAIITVAIFTFVRSWNEFFWPLIITHSDATRTVPVGLATFVGRGLSMQFGIVMSSAVTATIPAVIFFLVLQRYFVRGISTTGLRG
jgi:multiple sugar transport system permease protein